MSLTIDKARLRRLTERAEPKTAKGIADTVIIVREIAQHADERARFYGRDAESIKGRYVDPDVAARIWKIAEEWGELAAEASYRAEAIEAGTWAWL